MDNYYEILEIDSTVEEKEIKKAYTKLLRKYPPEKSPEEFKKIREAYETLGNPKSRAEYDALSEYQVEIDELLNSGRFALEEEDFTKAIIEFKKILVIEPSLSFARNLLGLALLHDSQYDAAIQQFEKLINDNNNAAYFFNLAVAYNEKGNYKKSEEMFSKALKLDKINAQIVLSFSRLYREQQKYDQAIEVLRDAIDFDGVINFQDFIYLFELVYVYIYADDIDGCETILDEIDSIISEDEEEQKYVAWQYAKLAYQLSKANIYGLAETIAERAFFLNPDDEDIYDLYCVSQEINEAFKLYELLLEDQSVAGPLKGPIFYYFYGKDMTEGELEKEYKENFEAIDSYIVNVSSQVISSVKRLKAEYTLLYEFKKELYDDIMQKAIVIELRDTQWNHLKEDYSVIDPLKRLIGLWFSQNLSDTERNRYFENIMNEMKQYPLDSALLSISIVKTKYPKLYTEYLDTLGADIKKYMNSLNATASTNFQNSSASSSICFVATAAFGTPWAPEIDVLRRWRDTVLVKSIAGRLFIAVYYKVGPYIAKVVEKSALLKQLVRNMIYELIRVLSKKYFTVIEK